MKFKFKTGFFLFTLIFSFVILKSQNSTTGIHSQFIVLISGDSIKNIDISIIPKFTNENKVTFINKTKETEVLKTKQVLKYFDGTRIYKSEQINHSANHKFIDYYAVGLIKVGLSMSEEGNYKFWLNTGNELYCLEEYKYNLNEFLSSKLTDFDRFLIDYNKKVNYNYKSLGEVISGYNAFMIPAKYSPSNFTNKKSFKLGLLVYPFNFSLFQSKTSVTGNIKAFQLGIYSEYSYTPYISLSILPSYYFNNTESFSKEIVINSINTDFLFNFMLINKKKFQLRFKTGLSVLFHIYSYEIDKFNNNWSSYLTSMGIGSNVGLDIKLNRNMFFNLGVQKLKLKSTNYDISNLNDGSIGSIINFKVGLSYIFYNKHL